jgi:hypothetical protein
MHEKEKKCMTLVGKPQEKGPLGRPINNWEYTMKMDKLAKYRLD